MTVISQEMIDDFVVRNRLGESIKSISLRHGVDPRTVKARIQKVEVATDNQHWQSVSRQVDVGYLREHHQSLINAASGLLDSISIEPLNILGNWEPQKWINGMVEFDPRPVPGVLSGRNSVALASTEKQRATLQRMRLKVLNGLLEHEPEIETALNLWKTFWVDVQKRRDELAEEARGLFEQNNVKDRVANIVTEDLVQDVLLTRFMGKQQGWLALEENANDKGDDQMKLFFKDDSTNKPLLTEQRQELEPVIESYKLVRNQIAMDARLTPMKEALDYFVQSVLTLEGLIDGLILRRRPQGRCQFCPR